MGKNNNEEIGRRKRWIGSQPVLVDIIEVLLRILDLTHYRSRRRNFTLQKHQKRKSEIENRV